MRLLAQSSIDLTPMGDAISLAFVAIGNMLLIVAGGAVFTLLVITGMSLLAIPINRRLADFVKGNIAWMIGGCAFLSGAGVLGKALGAAIIAGKI